LRLVLRDGLEVARVAVIPSQHTNISSTFWPSVLAAEDDERASFNQSSSQLNLRDDGGVLLEGVESGHCALKVVCCFYFVSLKVKREAPYRIGAEVN
jgi:hypothetical protein